MSLAAVAVRNQRRRAAQQQHQLIDDPLTQNASDPSLKLRKVRQFRVWFRVFVVSPVPRHLVEKHLADRGLVDQENNLSTYSAVKQTLGS